MNESDLKILRELVRDRLESIDAEAEGLAVALPESMPFDALPDCTTIINLLLRAAELRRLMQVVEEARYSCDERMCDSD